MKRYDLQDGGDMIADPKGDWVKYEDLSPASICSARVASEWSRMLAAGEIWETTPELRDALTHLSREQNSPASDTE